MKFYFNSLAFLKILILLFICPSVIYAQSPWQGSTNIYYNGGKVGIGTTSPQRPLHIVSSSLGLLLENSTNGRTIDINPGNGSIDVQNAVLSLNRFSNYNIALCQGGGNVGIGTSQPGSFKLAVEGKIGAREIQVMTTNPWPDYVFEKNYPLISLSALEAYLKENKHLPGIPNASEVEKNGINLGEMNAKLLKKLEELTLYIIDQNKRIKRLEKQK